MAGQGDLPVTGVFAKHDGSSGVWGAWIVLEFAHFEEGIRVKLVYSFLRWSHFLFPGKNLNVRPCSGPMGYFDDAANTIRISTPKLGNSRNSELASIFLHEAEHAGQFYAPALNFLGVTIKPLGWTRRLSALVMPPHTIGAEKLIRTLIYTAMPAEHLAAAGGVLWLHNVLGLVPRLYEAGISLALDYREYHDLFFRYQGR